jgi:hypothetical protein
MPMVFGEKLQTARKPYICSSCNSVIPIKTRYFKIGGLWDGGWENYKQCESCHTIAAKFIEYTGECVPIKDLILELQECDLIENQGEDDDLPVWVSNVDWLEIKSQNPLIVRAVTNS